MLKRTKDRKVTNSATTGANVRIANTFGLPSGTQFSCPGATATCADVCYAGKLEKQYPNVLKSLMHNWDIVRNATEAELVDILSAMIAEFVKDCNRHDAPKRFRLHYDGDMFSLEYASAWATVIRMFDEVQFWGYTRSFEFVHVFDGLDNLALYLSVDRDNANAAMRTKRYNPFVLLAGLEQTFDEAKALIGSGTRCPELNGALPMISPNGGACNTCGLCVEGRNNVTFSITKG